MDQLAFGLSIRNFLKGERTIMEAFVKFGKNPREARLQEVSEPEAGPGFGPAGTLLADRAADSGGTYPEMQQRRGG